MRDGFGRPRYSTKFSTAVRSFLIPMKRLIFVMRLDVSVVVVVESICMKLCQAEIDATLFFAVPPPLPRRRVAH